MVPSSRHWRDVRVGAVMVEVNRRLNLREFDPMVLVTIEHVARQIRESSVEAIASSCP